MNILLQALSVKNNARLMAAPISVDQSQNSQSMTIKQNMFEKYVSRVESRIKTDIEQVIDDSQRVQTVFHSFKVQDLTQTDKKRYLLIVYNDPKTGKSKTTIYAVTPLSDGTVTIQSFSKTSKFQTPSGWVYSVGFDSDMKPIAEEQLCAANGVTNEIISELSDELNYLRVNEPVDGISTTLA